VGGRSWDESGMEGNSLDGGETKRAREEKRKGGKRIEG